MPFFELAAASLLVAGAKITPAGSDIDNDEENGQVWASWHQSADEIIQQSSIKCFCDKADEDNDMMKQKLQEAESSSPLTCRSMVPPQEESSEEAEPEAEAEEETPAISIQPQTDSTLTSTEDEAEINDHENLDEEWQVDGDAGDDSATATMTIQAESEETGTWVVLDREEAAPSHPLRANSIEDRWELVEDACISTLATEARPPKRC
eukprot:TRINITY_DN113315_c0_g1_i1.p1 TRINITY_DN113315_c0_g1~~TRINITY_DN113315_c0_g1_i1.p1  ORF type:complete len:208 (+),score=52.52 TRINITY_DN113315_c0_g1_i1:104-727(+)